MNFSCAFSNTPKFTQVKQTGKGFIVGKQWILDCYKQDQLLSEKNYELKGSNNTPRKKETLGRNITNFDDEEPLISKDVIRKPSMKKKMTTFDDDDDDDEDEEPIITKKKIAASDDDDDGKSRN